jgi:hypothetical protein
MICPMPIAKQRVAKHFPAEAYRGTIGRIFLGNGAVNTTINISETVFFVGSASRLYKGVEHRIKWVANENENGSQRRSVRLKIDCELL